MLKLPPPRSTENKSAAAQAGEMSKLLVKYPYLAKYLTQVSKSLGSPEYLGQDISSLLKKAVKINALYQVDEGVFIHIYTPPLGSSSGFRKYVIIEPSRPPQELVKLVEEKIASVLTEKDRAESISERRNILLRALQRVVELTNTPVNYSTLLPKVSKLNRIPVYSGDFNNLLYHLNRDKVGLGILDPLLKDRYIEDIYCNGVGYVYIVHKVFGPLETNIYFPTEEDLSRFVLELSEKIGKPVSHARPIVDATLPDGSRINIVFGSDVSLKGSSFTIRKFSKVPMSVIDLVNLGTMDEYVAAYLWMLLLEGMSGFISGETASGKTTTLNAIVAFIRPVAKIVSIEDTAEIQVPHENWLRELTRDTGSIETSVTLFDLLKAALRQRPNYIIVGEIRGAEGNVAFQAMQTGHPVLSTFHAASVERLVQRLTSTPINVPKTHLDNLNFVLIQSAVYREGIMLRRVISVNELVGYDPRSDTTIYIPIYTWDPVKDRFTFRGRGTSYLLEEKVATVRGISRRNMSIIYDELGLRAKILRELAAKKVTNYYDVFKVITRIYSLIDSKAKASSKEDTPYVVVEALEECLLKLKSGELLK
ncbi:MAG: type II/IV secretion system ATPase subunit [Sulfolobales archaeon]|nr:type II/IV secretion system ATPase subunit [Sulfolobales archaeon]MDW8083023.1 type II/IV secretion system ATPase subunit [Sulfolobales archaeon]